MLWKFRKRKKKPGPRRAIIATVVLALYTFAGFFVLPPVVKTQLERRATTALGRAVTVGKVRVNPYTLSVTLENLEVREAGGGARETRDVQTIRAVGAALDDAVKENDLVAPLAHGNREIRHP